MRPSMAFRQEYKRSNSGAEAWDQWRELKECCRSQQHTSKIEKNKKGRILLGRISEKIFGLQRLQRRRLGEGAKGAAAREQFPARRDSPVSYPSRSPKSSRKYDPNFILR